MLPAANKENEMRPFSALLLLLAMAASMTQGSQATKGVRLEHHSWREAEKLLLHDAVVVSKSTARI
jgi:hypothetical protein